MKYIVKAREPKELIEYRAKPDACFDNCPAEVKYAMRQQLIEEQHGLCAYCMARINDEWNEKLQKFRTEIEHYLPQSAHAINDLDYSNLLGVCNGNAGYPKHKQHCDKSKADQTIIVNPLRPDCETHTIFNRSGEITSTIKEIEADLAKTLNLNEQTLVKNRQVVIQHLYESLSRICQRGNTKLKAIKKLIDYWQAIENKMLKEYCQTAIFFLNKEFEDVQRSSRCGVRN